jgi:hypothetical protein
MLPQYATSNLVEWQSVFDTHLGEMMAYLQSLPPNRSVDILGLVAHGLIDVGDTSLACMKHMSSADEDDVILSLQILGEVVLDTQIRAVSDFAKDKPNAIARAITFWPKRGTIVRSTQSGFIYLAELTRT